MEPIRGQQGTQGRVGGMENGLEHRFMTPVYEEAIMKHTTFYSSPLRSEKMGGMAVDDMPTLVIS